MYELILSHVDALSASLGLLRKSHQTRKGVNPWGYTNGSALATGVFGEEGEGEWRELEVLEKGTWSSRSSLDSTDGSVEGRGRETETETVVEVGEKTRGAF